MTEIKKEKEEPKRSFGGKTENFENKKEENLEKKHLRAYLKGFKRYITSWTLGLPNYSPVKEIWT